MPAAPPPAPPPAPSPGPAPSAAQLVGLQCLCVEATEERGRLRLVVDLVAPTPARAVRLTARLRGPGVDEQASRDDQVGPGPTRIEWTLEVDEPPRWWPWRLGPQPLVDLVLTVEEDGHETATVRLRTAFREVRLDEWILFVNTERLFVCGVELPPLPEAEAREALEAAVDHHVDLVRFRGHVPPAAVHERADELGLLVWQDVPRPVAPGGAATARARAVAEAGDLVARRGHHPSIVLWCGHDVPGRRAVPGWDPTDRAVRRALATADRWRPVDPRSPSAPGIGSGGDARLDLGAWRGGLGDPRRWLRRWPRAGRFVGGIPSDDPAHLAGVLAALRRVRFRPTGGLVVTGPTAGAGAGGPAHPLADPGTRRVLADLLRPVVPLVDPRTGAVHVVNETLETFHDAVVRVRPGGSGPGAGGAAPPAPPAAAWRGTVRPDAVTPVGRLRPAPGPAPFVVELSHPALGVVRSEPVPVPPGSESRR